MPKAKLAGIKTIMQVIISLSVLGGALYIILSQQFPGDYAKWAFGVIGVIIGYWLK